MPARFPAIVLQARDVDVLSSLGEHGMLDTDLIHEHHFAGRSRRRCLQRLAILQEHGLLRPLPIQVWTAGIGRKLAAVYQLTSRGCDLVESQTGAAPRRVSRGEPQGATLNHRLQIVRTKLAFDLACRTSGIEPGQWIFEQDRDPSASGDLPPNQRRLLYHAFEGDPPCTCQPDAACRLAIPRREGAGEADLIGFFEIDCSTEGRKQVASKLPGYARLIAERPMTYFPDGHSATVRVFWVCRSWKRVAFLREQFAKNAVADYFRFTTEDELTPSTALASPIWSGLDGARRAILKTDTHR